MSMWQQSDAWREREGEQHKQKMEQKKHNTSNWIIFRNSFCNQMRTFRRLNENPGQQVTVRGARDHLAK